MPLFLLDPEFHRQIQVHKQGFWFPPVHHNCWSQGQGGRILVEMVNYRLAGFRAADKGCLASQIVCSRENWQEQWLWKEGKQSAKCPKSALSESWHTSLLDRGEENLPQTTSGPLLFLIFIFKAQLRPEMSVTGFEKLHTVLNRAFLGYHFFNSCNKNS